jgi:hypothetical protein
MHDMKWSHAEKKIARQAYERALAKKFGTVIDETKRRASRISQPGDLWDLEHWLTDQRNEIDQIFDYRYSVLIQTFAILMTRRLLTEDDLHGLAPEKITAILRLAQVLSEWDQE